MKKHKVHLYAKFHGTKASVLAHYNGVSALSSVVMTIILKRDAPAGNKP